VSTAELIRQRAQRLRQLNDEVDATLCHRNEGAAQEERWRAACKQFHDEYDRLAFPGGAAEGIRKLAAHDQDAIETAVVFLETDPLFFRSGYIKEELIEKLRWAPLNTDQKSRLQQVILARIRDPKTRREFRRYCRLAPFVTDSEFEKSISELAGPSGAKPKRAQWVLEHLKQGVSKQRSAKS